MSCCGWRGCSKRPVRGLARPPRRQCRGSAAVKGGYGRAMDAVEAVRWHHHPTFRSPVLVAAFEGWNDAGDGASGAAAYLADTWEAETFAAIDPEEFYDFTLARPEVRLEDGLTRRIEWPEPRFSVATPPGCTHDIVFLQAGE